jgi:hypothetical protein
VAAGQGETRGQRSRPQVAGTQQAWSPIGGISFYRESQHTSTLEDPAVVKIAEPHSKSPAQVVLRWHLQEGCSVSPKSTTPRRITENFGALDFELTTDEVAAIDRLDTGMRGGPEPGGQARTWFELRMNLHGTVRTRVSLSSTIRPARGRAGACTHLHPDVSRWPAASARETGERSTRGQLRRGRSAC